MTWFIYQQINIIIYKCKLRVTVSKVGDRSRGRLEGSLFNSFYTKM